MLDNKDDIVLTTTIISMAESLGLTTVAEGAETIEQYTLLRELGCTEVQGFYFSPPVVPETLTTFLQEHKKVEFNWVRPKLN
jgi:EAL domain-containing protein (putative c-di-GMP-specific phosphodiesterase class I)